MFSIRNENNNMIFLIYRVSWLAILNLPHRHLRHTKLYNLTHARTLVVGVKVDISIT